MDAQEKIAAAAKKHGKAWGRPVGSAEDAKVIIDLGAQLVVLGSMHRALVQHLGESAEQFDAALG